MNTSLPSEAASAVAQPLSDGERSDRSYATRIVHLLMLLVVLNQLVGSQFMDPPDPGEAPSSVYVIHQYSGLAGSAVVAAFWIWTLVRRGETSVGRLVPWLSRRRLRDVGVDLAAQLRRLMRGRGPDDSDGALSSAVHGLGLLAVTAMAATGSLWFFAHGTPAAHLAMDVHTTIANLVWAYLFAHASLAVIHWALGSNIFARMFWPSRRAAS